MASSKERTGSGLHRRPDVIQSLQVGKSQRSNQDIQDIMNFILTNCCANLFQEISEDSFSKLCRGITLDEFKQDEIIMEQGSVSDYMLILIRGKVDVFRSENGSRSQPGRFIASLSKPGDFAGELGLAENVPRNSTVIASQNTWCMRIDGNRSRNVIKKQLRSDQLARMQKVTLLPYFTSDSGPGNEEFIRDLAQSLKSQTFRARDVIFKEGNAVEEVSFIISGSIGLRKRDRNSTLLNGRHVSSASPLRSQLMVCFLGFGEIIGGEALDPSVTEPKYQFTAIAETKVELFALPRASIRVLDRNTCRDEILKLFQIRQAARLKASSDQRRITGAALNDYLRSARHQADATDQMTKRRSAHSAAEILLRLPSPNVGIRFAPNPPCRRCRADITGIRPLPNRRLIPLSYNGTQLVEWHKDGHQSHRHSILSDPLE